MFFADSFEYGNPLFNTFRYMHSINMNSKGINYFMQFF